MMGASYFGPPWLWQYFSNDSLKWRQQFAWWPRRSSESNRRIWLTKCWYGHKLIYGPAGEDPVKVERWLTDEEYMWHQLSDVQ